ncbi:hypothetical protein B0I33_105252 [Prauserella shujinwangii]|uniref:PE family protein n=1 Tax=Prauserella shujinwangii TaxID=1453103 RepID=A0A2T0LV03_9PSEU|nr:hypothetical protein [Prauserella shujinwangii]PRX47672.1 hypothetical protein B0I33_105252 [Prauserella shujinwangii]
MLPPVDRLPTAPPIPPIGIAGAAAGAAALGVAAAKQVSTLSGGGAGGAGGGGYTFTPEEIDEVIRQWEDLYDDLLKDETDARDVANVKAPGTEFASGDFQQAAQPSGNALLEQTKRMREYVYRYIEALKQAKGATQAQDENAAADANSAGGMLGS